MTDAGARIRARREMLGMTQEELAHKVGYKSRVSINKIELKRDIPLKKLKPIADALEIDVWELMGWEDNINEETGAWAADYLEDVELVEYVRKIQQARPELRKKILTMIDVMLAE